MNRDQSRPIIGIGLALTSLATGILACTTPASLTCGAGTHEQDGACLADAAPPPSVVVQTGTAVVPPTGTPPSGWYTTYAAKLGITLDTQYDSSGPDAWDAAAHPNVFITSVGPGYGGQLAGTVKWPGAVVIDSDTHEVLAYAAFDLSGEGWKEADVFEPHELGVSPDGKWIYIPTANTSSKGKYLVVNARTLKLDKMIATRGRPHHAQGFTDSGGKGKVLLGGWEQPPFVLDPADDNKVVGGLDFNDLGMEGYLYFIDPSGKELWASGRWRMGNARNEIEGNVLMIADAVTWKLKAYVPFPQESTPVWIDFSPDNKYAYATGGHGSKVLKYDRIAKKTMGISRAGVEGPYGIRLGWDGTRIYAVGKGEGSTNLGKDLGVLDTKSIETSSSAKDQITTGCVRGDHATLQPDPAKNELWLSCNSSFEIAIFNMTSNTITGRIPMPSSGSTHSGSFVKYSSTWVGELQSDVNGLHGATKATSLAMQK